MGSPIYLACILAAGIALGAVAVFYPNLLRLMERTCGR